MTGEHSNTVCAVCEREKEVGILVYHTFICRECENEIVATDPSDNKYAYFLKKLRVMNKAKLHS
ncbi:sigma factor G inhibitor Gin [Pontibacillus litoralis]|uniref:CsfB n=1 Tax=Pontibacillus litoralis JSM 072002 TaxID=1385512 RepID=A0A0A5G2U1_9BACI|nr:sigma factor G inhibitor Gin [Pontibacillus litoralis]KGX85453.1 CsfB [Pontibacillus litoralis JSM 072002]